MRLRLREPISDASRTQPGAPGQAGDDRRLDPTRGRQRSILSCHVIGTRRDAQGTAHTNTAFGRAGAHAAHCVREGAVGRVWGQQTWSWRAARCLAIRRVAGLYCTVFSYSMGGARRWRRGRSGEVHNFYLVFGCCVRASHARDCAGRTRLAVSISRLLWARAAQLGGKSRTTTAGLWRAPHYVGESRVCMRESDRRRLNSAAGEHRRGSVAQYPVSWLCVLARREGQSPPAGCAVYPVCGEPGRGRLTRRRWNIHTRVRLRDDTRPDWRAGANDRASRSNVAREEERTRVPLRAGSRPRNCSSMIRRRMPAKLPWGFGWQWSSLSCSATFLEPSQAARRAFLQPRH